MTIGEKIEKFFVETDWKKVDRNIKKTFKKIQVAVEEQKRKYEKKLKEKSDK